MGHLHSASSSLLGVELAQLGDCTGGHVCQAQRQREVEVLLLVTESMQGGVDLEGRASLQESLRKRARGRPRNYFFASTVLDRERHP